MKYSLAVLLIVVSSLFIAADLSADDLGLIQLNSQEQVARAELILGHALVKVDGKFLVLASTDQQYDLQASGIGFESIRRTADISSLYMILPRTRQAAESGAPNIGPVVASATEMTVVETSASAAASVAEERDYFVIPLADRPVYFHYDPPMHVRAILPTEVYPSDTLIDLVSQDSIYAYNRRLELFYTRYIWSDSIDRARDWMVNKFQQFGYSAITTPTFTYSGGTHYNVKVVKTGTTEPNKVVVIGGHYDTYNAQSPGSIYAPGSDDDGSGTTLTMEVARVLANVPLRKTVIFMPFSAEEVGLIGSNAAAVSFRNAGTNVEAMLNYDMVGYVEDYPWRLNLSSGSNTAYRDLTAANATRLTSLVPNIVSMGSSSDHYPFFQQGFPVCDNIETDFNYDGWHTNLDLTSRMNFNYLTEVVKLAVATVAIVANAASTTSISSIEDVGNGSQLELFWSDCNPQYSYTIFYGPSGSPTDSVQVPPGNCSWVVSGLTEGVTYTFAVYGKPADGYRAIAAPTRSEQSLIAPRAPLSPEAEPGLNSIILSWRSGIEQDVVSYRVYRKLHTETNFTIWQSGVTDTTFTDNQVTALVEYDYAITAVDQLGNESPLSATVSSYPASFDGGILIVDEWIQDYAYFPDQAEQLAWMDTVMGSTPFMVETVETSGAALTKGNAGRFSSIFWMDEDIFTKILTNSNSTLDWYLSNPTNVMIDGYQTIQNWSTYTVPPDHLLRREFGVSNFNYSSSVGFIGAFGDNGWPSVQLDPGRGLSRIWDTPIVTPVAGATVIYRFDASSNNAGFEGEPCGLAVDGPTGKRIILTFPIYYLTASSATALLEKAKQFFGESSNTSLPGDINMTGGVDLSDLSLMIAYLTISHLTLPNPNGADVNGSCNIDLTDLSTLIQYLLLSTPQLQPGCMN
ncbi:MAG: M28 family peptidase [bacterium]|nr:M28 family peptidase [bacterium]